MYTYTVQKRNETVEKKNGAAEIHHRIAAATCLYDGCRATKTASQNSSESGEKRYRNRPGREKKLFFGGTPPHRDRHTSATTQ